MSEDADSIPGDALDHIDVELAKLRLILNEHQQQMRDGLAQIIDLLRPVYPTQ